MAPDRRIACFLGRLHVRGGRASERLRGFLRRVRFLQGRPVALQDPRRRIQPVESIRLGFDAFPEPAGGLFVLRRLPVEFVRLPHGGRRRGFGLFGLADRGFGLPLAVVRVLERGLRAVTGIAQPRDMLHPVGLAELGHHLVPEVFRFGPPLGGLSLGQRPRLGQGIRELGTGQRRDGSAFGTLATRDG